MELLLILADVISTLVVIMTCRSKKNKPEKTVEVHPLSGEVMNLTRKQYVEFTKDRKVVKVGNAYYEINV